MAVVSCDSLYDSLVTAYREMAVVSRDAWHEGGEAGHEEVEAGEGDHVDRQLPQVSIELAGEPEAILAQYSSNGT